MSNPVPSSLALTTIANDAEIIASDHRNNYSAIQTAVNALITALSGGTANQVLTAADSTDVSWSDAPSRVLHAYSGNPLTNLVSSTTETDLFGTAGSGYSLAGGTLGTTGRVKIELLGEYFNSSGSTDNLTLKLYYGSSAVSSGTLANATSANKFLWSLTVRLQALGATNAQLLFGDSRGGNTNMDGAKIPPSGATGISAGILAIDSTAAQNLRVTAQHSVNNASTYLKVYAAVISI